MAMTEWMLYRRNYIRCLKATDGNYEGVYAKAHDKLAKATQKWSEAAQRSLDNFLKIIRELEIVREKRSFFRGRPTNFFNNSLSNP